MMSSNTHGQTRENYDAINISSATFNPYSAGIDFSPPPPLEIE